MATWYVYLIIGIVVLVVLGLMFYASRYRRFDTSFYVIHFRGGKVIRAGQGGKAVVLPLIDEIRTIPVTTQSTFLEAKEKVVSREFQEISVTAFVFWRVVDPEVAFARVVWDQTSSAYVENIIKNATESIIRTVTANMQLEKIIRDRQAIIESVIKELHTLTRDWGLIIESVEIREIEIIDPKLKENVSAIMKIEQEKLARLKKADMEESTKLRDLEVQRKVEMERQGVQLDIETKQKDREIKIQELEKKRTEVEAKTYQTKVEIEANAEKYRKIASEVDVEAEKIRRMAAAKQFELESRAKGEAAMILEARKAEAEGILARIQALAKADSRFFQEMIIARLPEIYQNLEIDKMIVTGSKEDAFSTIANSMTPFLQIIQELAEKTKLGESKKK